MIRAQIEGLEKVFETFGKRPEGATCEALLGLLKESKDLLKDTAGVGPVQDAGLIAHAQAVLHYASARYGTLLAWAAEVGQQHAADVLRQMLEASKRANETFNEVAMQGINKAAAGPA